MPHACPSPKPSPLFDRLGAAGSLLCALHCALLPLAIAVLPALGIALWDSDLFELGFVVFATLLGVVTLVRGYRRHRVGRALALLVPGLAVLWLGLLAAPLHTQTISHAVTMTIGGTLVGLAHLTNLRLSDMQATAS